MCRRRVALLAVVASFVVGLAPAPRAAALAAGQVLDVTVAGRAGVPTAGVGAVVLNVTATDVESASFVTVWPTGSSRPLASNLNLAADDTVANLVLVALGDGGKVSLYQHGGPAELVVDVTGWFPAGAGVRAVTPARVLDTRSAAVPLLAGSTVAVTVAGRAGVPSSGAAAVMVNLTATNATTTTFLTAWSGTGARPLASNLNPIPGRTVANLALVPLADDGSLSIGNLAGSVDVIVDVLGWVPTGAPGATVQSPVRLLDTRAGDPVGAGASVVVDAPAAARLAGASALFVNVTVTGATAATFLALAGSGTSSINTVPGRTAANLALLPLDASGRAVLTNHAGRVDVIVDLLGWLTGGSGYTNAGPTRLADTRVARAVPVAAGTNVAWVGDHHDYPATDIFAACGSVAVSPATGTVVHVRRDDRYVRGVDNPALRGGRSVAILGDDGVRYYMSHFASIDAETVVGARVVAGQRIAILGQSGDAGGCHIHFGLSPDCPQLEWSVRRGVIWPYPYLNEWRAGRNRSPAPEIAAWSAAHPTACTDAAADPYAQDAG